MKHRPEISILIPFSSKDPIRRRNLKWLLEYLRCELPDAEVIIGKSRSKVFCKGEALNNAIKKSHGKVIVVLDADTYIRGHVIKRCADRILEELSYGNRLWYVPYHHLFRLKKWVTDIIIESDPCDPFVIPTPVPSDYIENQGDMIKYGRRYGAMITIFPREAFDILGCFDERFRGWGGEDVAFVRAMDTLYTRHKSTHNDVFHLWHSFIGKDYKSRKWEHQTNPNANGRLANLYHKYTNHPHKMRELVDEGCRYKHHKNHKHDISDSNSGLD